MLKKNRKIFLFFVLSLFFLVPPILLFKINTSFLHPQPSYTTKYFFSKEFVKAAALCYDEIVADLLWIQAIGYFGEHFYSDKDYSWLSYIFNIIITLDPAYEEVYEHGGVILANELIEVDSSLEILQKGMDHVPLTHSRYWYLPFYAAFNFMYYKGDYLTAARYLEQAAQHPQSPAYLPFLVARLYANTDDPGMAIPFLEKMLEAAKSQEAQKNLRQRIQAVQVKQHINLLSTAKKQFLERTGMPLKNLEELISSKILHEIPVEPYGGQYQITENGTIQSTSNPDTLELHINTKPSFHGVIQGQK